MLFILCPLTTLIQPNFEQITVTFSIPFSIVFSILIFISFFKSLRILSPIWKEKSVLTSPNDRKITTVEHLSLCLEIDFFYQF